MAITGDCCLTIQRADSLDTHSCVFRLTVLTDEWLLYWTALTTTTTTMIWVLCCWHSPFQHCTSLQITAEWWRYSSNSIVSFGHHLKKTPLQTHSFFLSFLTQIMSLLIPCTRCATELDSFRGCWHYRSLCNYYYYYYFVELESFRVDHNRQRWQ